MDPFRESASDKGLAPSRLLAHFVDDCWEPRESAAILRELTAKGSDEDAREGTSICLRVAGGKVGSARVIPADYECDPAERPGSAAYLWVLYSGSPPSREALIDLYAEFARASDESTL